MKTKKPSVLKPRFLICSALILFLVSCAPSREIIDKPILFDEERKALTLEYLSERYGLEQETPVIDPKMIVLHWTVIPTMAGSYDVFNPSRIAGWREYVQKTSALNVSAHFLVDQDGTIYQLMPETTMARHVIGLNPQNEPCSLLPWRAPLWRLYRVEPACSTTGLELTGLS